MWVPLLVVKAVTSILGQIWSLLAPHYNKQVHAEQSAVTHAWLRGESRLVAITVNYTPCGHCRRFMNELNSGTHIAEIHLPGRKVATFR